MSNSTVADDGLYVDSGTTIEEIQDFLYRRSENPIEVNGTTVWNFSSYNVDERALEEAIENKLRKDEFIIPFQVAGTWGLMYHLLPRKLKEAEILVYHQNSGEYRAFNNFINRMPQKSEDEFRYQLGQAVFDNRGDNDVPDGG